MALDVKRDFPVLQKNPNLVYLDSACTSLKPTAVIDAVNRYYSELGACGGRSAHKLGKQVSDELDAARETTAKFLGASAQELIWTRNTTEGLNLIIDGLDYSKRNKVVTTVLEHHSVLLPLLKLRDEGKIKLEVLQCQSDGTISEDSWKKAIDSKTALVVTNSATNTTGQITDVAKLAKMAHDAGAFVCIDGAQGTPHLPVDFKKLGVDFLAFSGHKMLGPTGIGGLLVKKSLLGQLKSYNVGGGTIKHVSAMQPVYVDDVTRFEAGIQHYSGILGMAAACDYLSKIGMKKVMDHDVALANALCQAASDAGAVVYGSLESRTALCAFNFKGAKPHEVALMLDKQNIAVRSGFFCAQPGMEALGAKQGAVRASAYLYNSLDDVAKFGEALKKLSALYR